MSYATRQARPDPIGALEERAQRQPAERLPTSSRAHAERRCEGTHPRERVRRVGPGGAWAADPASYEQDGTSASARLRRPFPLGSNARRSGTRPCAFPTRRVVRRQHGDDGHPRGEPASTPAGASSSTRLCGRVDAEQRRGAQIAGRIGLAVLDLLGGDEHLGHRDARPRAGERRRARASPEVTIAKRSAGTDSTSSRAPGSARRPSALSISSRSIVGRLRLGVEVRGDEADQVDDAPAVALRRARARRRARAARRRRARSLDLRAGVDEHAVEVGEHGARLEQRGRGIAALAPRPALAREQRERDGRRATTMPSAAAQPDRAGGEADRRRAGEESQPADRRDGRDADARPTRPASSRRRGRAPARRRRGPRPWPRSPTSAAGVEPTTSASASPDAASRPPPRASATGPKRPFRRSPTQRLVGHREREARVAERGHRGGRAERVREVDGAPVGRGSLGEQREERRRAEHEQRPRRADEDRRRPGVVRLRRQQPPPGDESATTASDERERSEVRARPDARAPPRARRGPRRRAPPALNAAWNEERIERPYSRSRARPCAFAATFIAPKPAPKPNSAAASPPRPPASEARKSAALPPTSAAIVTRRLPTRSHSQPGERHRDERSERHREEREAELRVRQAGLRAAPPGSAPPTSRAAARRRRRRA